MRDWIQFYTWEQNLPLIFSIWGLSSFNSEPLNVTGILSIFKFCIKNSSTAAFIEELANLWWKIGENVVRDDIFQKISTEKILLTLPWQPPLQRSRWTCADTASWLKIFTVFYLIMCCWFCGQIWMFFSLCFDSKTECSFRQNFSGIAKLFCYLTKKRHQFFNDLTFKTKVKFSCRRKRNKISKAYQVELPSKIPFQKL